MQVDKNIPMPRRDGKGLSAPGSSGRPPKYPFRNMEIGESFFADDEGVRNCAHQAKIRLGRVFSVRKVEGGFRCWRLE